MDLRVPPPIAGAAVPAPRTTSSSVGARGHDPTSQHRYLLIGELLETLPAGPRSIEETLAAVLRLLCRDLIDAGAIWVPGPDGQSLKMQASNNCERPRDDASTTVPIERESRTTASRDGFVGAAFLRPTPTIANDCNSQVLAAIFPTEPSTDAGQLPLRHLAGIPIRVGDHNIGILICARVSSSSAFTDEQVALLSDICNVAGGFIEQARILDQVRDQTRALESVSDAVIAVDEHRVVRSWNKGAVDLYGIDTVDALGRPLGALIQTQVTSTQDTDDAWHSLATSTTPYRRRLTQRTVNGRTVQVESMVRAMLNEDGEFAGAVGVNRDISDLVTAEARVEERNQFATAVLEALPGRTCVTDDRGIIAAVNLSYRVEGPLGEGPSTGPAIGTSYVRWLSDLGAPHPSHSQLLDALTSVQENGERGGTHRIEIAMTREAELRWIAIEIVPMPSEMGGAILSHVDVTAEKSIESELTRRATHDALTGLPNRLLLSDRLDHALVRARRSGRQVAVLFCDLDQFKMVNDTLGHAAGDQLLVIVAQRLKEACRDSDTVARLGGDEFVVLLEDVADPQAVADTAERVLYSLAQPVDLGGAVVTTAASIGVAVSHPSTMNTAASIDGPQAASSLLRDADAAMFAAKESGRGRVTWFEDTVRDRITQRLRLTGELRDVVARDQLRVAFQPIVDPTGRALGAEALIRWQHPSRGALLPAAFLDTAEESGAIIPMGRWVLAAACTEAVKWWRPDGVRPSVSVNLSPRELASRALIDDVRNVLDRTGLPASSLVLEVTEAALSEEPRRGAATLHQLRAMGVRIALDDFGLGASSLSLLRHVSVDQVKIDRTFVSDVGEGATSHALALVDGLVTLAHGLGALAVAEGVETTPQFNAMKRAGCDLFQGYLWAPALSPAETESLMRGARSTSGVRRRGGR